jgi:hypothetical protein
MRPLSSGGEETEVKVFQMALPQPGFSLMTPRPEDEDGNEIAALPEEEEELPGGYTVGEARRIFPAVVIKPVRFYGGSDDPMSVNKTTKGMAGRGLLTVSLTVGTFDDSPECVEGLKWVINILERVRQGFEKKVILEDRYKIILPLSYELFEEAIRPFWFGEMTTEWSIPLMFREQELLHDYRGANYPSGDGNYPNG